MRPGKYFSLLITILASAIAISLPLRSDAADGVSPSQRAEVTVHIRAGIAPSPRFTRST